MFEHEDTLAEVITELLAVQGMQRIVTLGRAGYDGHPDHVTTHLAGERAIKQLAQTDRQLEHLALNDTHTGEWHRPATDLWCKLGAMSCHASQFAITRHPGHLAIEPAFWESFSPYHPLILQGETYDLA